MQYRNILNYVKTVSVLFVLFLLFVSGNPLQDNDFRGTDAMRVVFYNVENLFDPFRDSTINDAEFSPQGIRGWSYTRFVKKCQQLGKVLISTGGWEAPDIIGLCEIENRFVLKKLLEHSALGKLEYQIVHYDSPDSRGIDVALLFRPEKFLMLHSEPIPVVFPGEDARSTRDILYVKGLAMGVDTLHFFVNHWPSRYGGYMVTKPLREFTGRLLRSKSDSILLLDPMAGILMMGDFNDPPDEYSLEYALGAKPDTLKLDQTDLYNLMSGMFRNPLAGSHKFQEHWSTIDQFIVSKSLLFGWRNLSIHQDGARIFSEDFILEDDPVHGGKRPNRTYNGMQYKGGFSDHLPIVVDIMRPEKR